MLSHIHIKDLAIVSALNLELNRGMTALTGETGAGKSILIDALGLVLGDRADNGMIRSGCDRAEITVTFDITDLPQIHQWLAEQALDAGNECLLRRVLVRDSRSRAFINDSPISAQLLQTLGEQLVDIHGQHAHQSLVHRNKQRGLLDAYANHRELVTETSRLYQEWRQTQTNLEQLRTSAEERNSRLDLLRYQSNELAELQLGKHELTELDEEHHRLSNAEQLQRVCTESIEALYNAEESTEGQLGRISTELGSMEDKQLAEAQALLESARIQVEEATSSLRHYAERIELNPERLEQLDARIGQIHDLARKYRVRPEVLNEKLQQLQTELAELEQADDQLAQLEERCHSLHQSYLNQSQALSKSRKAAAKKLQKDINKTIHELGMPAGKFEISIQPLEQSRESASGLDQIEFLVSANPGHPLQPLAKVASGGELSRISLAIQVATIQCGEIPTLIFDEVDSGIGGGIAEIVGRLLSQLGAERQVLCVTHLPQVAAQGQHHLQISKKISGKNTHTQVHPLGKEAQIEEIARMLGGVKITSQTLAHAKEMVEASQG